MRKLILYVCQSLDGFIARSDHGLDWLPPVEEKSYNKFIKDIDVILMGRKTYDVIKDFDHWPYTQQCYVFTRHPEKYADARVTFTNEDPVTLLAKLREKPGMDIWLEGGSELIHIFHEAGLIDEYIIAVVAVTIGDGIPLFSKSEKTVKMRLTSMQKLNDVLFELRFQKESENN